MINAEIIQEILDTGLVIAGAKKCGKSNSAKVLASEITKSYKDIQVRIFDTCQVWVHMFEPIVYQVLNDDTRNLYVGEQNVLYDIEYLDDSQIMKTIGQIVMHDYEKQRSLKKQGKQLKWIVYFIEEAQNILGSYNLTKEEGKLWLKFISEGRNFNLAFVFIGQRIADISTKAIERAQGYLFGKANGDNDKKKIKRIVGDAKIDKTFSDGEWTRTSEDNIIEEVGRLERGEFVYFNGVNGKLLKFKEYKVETKPILVEKE